MPADHGTPTGGDERSAMQAVRRHFQYLGLAGPTVAQAEQVIDGLHKAGMLKRDVKP